MIVPRLSDLGLEHYYDLEKEYKAKLETGIYHLQNFRIFTEPVLHHYIAFLDCEEGKFHSQAFRIINDLQSHIGALIKTTLEHPEVSSIEVEIVPFRSTGKKKTGHSWSLGFYLAPHPNQKQPKPEPAAVSEPPMLANQS